jgi:hypothetical protein
VEKEHHSKPAQAHQQPHHHLSLELPSPVREKSCSEGRFDVAMAKCGETTPHVHLPYCSAQTLIYRWNRILGIYRWNRIPGGWTN